MADISLTNVAVLARIEIRTWTGEKRDRKVSDEIASRHGTDRKTAGSFVKNLLGRSKKKLDHIRNLAQAARADATRYSLPYHTEGYRIVPVDELNSYMERLNNHETTYDNAVDSFLDNFDVMIQEAKDSLNGMFDPDNYPSKRELREKFQFHHHIEPIPESNQFDNLLGLPELESRLKTELADTLRETAEAANGHLLQTLADTVTELHDKFRDYTGGKLGSWRDEFIDNRKGVMDTVDSLNLFSDSQITGWTNRVRTVLNMGTDLRESDLKRANAVAELSRILTEMGVHRTESPTIDSVADQESNPVDDTPDAPQADLCDHTGDLNESADAPDNSPEPPVTVTPKPVNIDMDAALAELGF